MIITVTSEAAKKEHAGLISAIETAMREARGQCLNVSDGEAPIDGRRLALVKTKLEEALLWAGGKL